MKMKNNIYISICMLLAFLSHRTDAMQNPRPTRNATPLYKIHTNTYGNFLSYKRQLNSRFNPQRPCYGITPYAETAADFIPLLGASLVPMGLTNKLINSLPFLDTSDKNLIAKSLNRALILNLVPATYDAVKPAKEVLLPCHVGRQIEALDANPGLYLEPYDTWLMPLPYSPHWGKSLRSPIATSLVFVSSYTFLDLAMHTEEAKAAGAYLNKHIEIEPGTGEAVAQFAAFCASAFARSRV
jgi:hypothetical protein